MGSTEQSTAGKVDRPSSRRRLIWIGAGVALAVVALLVAWLLIDRSGNDSATPITTATPVAPRIVSSKTLSELVAKTGRTVYWAGPIPGKRLEYTMTNDGRAFVRYLSVGVKAGDPRSTFLVVATYPLEDAYDSLMNVSEGKEAAIPGGGIAAVSSGQAQSVHFAFPDLPYQGEVYHPSPAKSLAVATSGAIQPVP